MNGSGGAAHLGPYEILAPAGAAYSRDENRLQRFQQEARAAGILNHPNILAIYDVGETDERAPYPFVFSEQVGRDVNREGELAAEAAIVDVERDVRDPHSAQTRSVRQVLSPSLKPPCKIARATIAEVR